ncbi:hypothetical protein LWI29_031938 [Acer saccharum]|uniref:Uncharacterized protein n=1 Tax=Acer saccharum TaxID=4024 RepID=A0AA39V9Z0_ACESA|nr:hypothetical protein LWI29_031938 [Acer saccharum]
MRSLESLDLSNNQLFGEIPEHLVEGCISLAFLVLSNNSLQGQIFSKNFNLPNLLRLQLDGSHFIGNIPDSLLNSSLLVGLYLSDNHPSGRILSWLGNMLDLSDIIMPNNNFEGPIPVEFCQLEYLEVLDLSENNISSDFPSCLNSLYIHQVHLSRNKLQGQLKEAFYDSSYNHFDGSIPKWIGRLPQLSYQSIQSCRLDQLHLIDLSRNNLSSRIPPCLDMTALHNKDYDVAPGPMSMAPGPIAGVGQLGLR